MVVPTSILYFCLLRRASIPLAYLLKGNFRVHLSSVVSLPPFTTRRKVQFLVQFLAFPMSIIVYTGFLFRVYGVLFIRVPF